MRTERFHCLICGTECDSAEILYFLPRRVGFWSRLWDRLTSHGIAHCPRCYSTMLRHARPVAPVELAPATLPIFDEIDDDEGWKAIK